MPFRYLLHFIGLFFGYVIVYTYICITPKASTMNCEIDYSHQFGSLLVRGSREIQDAMFGVSESVTAEVEQIIQQLDDGSCQEIPLFWFDNTDLYDMGNQLAFGREYKPPPQRSFGGVRAMLKLSPPGDVIHVTVITGITEDVVMVTSQIPPIDIDDGGREHKETTHI